MDLTKDAKILKLIKDLSSELGAKSFCLVDHWDADLCAIGIASVGNPHRLVYVSTYGEEDLFFASTEFPNDEADANRKNHPYIPGDDIENMTFEDLVLLLKKHILQNS